MKIQILGTGCPKCQTLTRHAEQAASELGIEYELEKVTDMDQILSFGIMMTPGLAIDGEVQSSGQLLSVDKIKGILQDRSTS